MKKIQDSAVFKMFWIENTSQYRKHYECNNNNNNKTEHLKYYTALDFVCYLSVILYISEGLIVLLSIKYNL